MSIRPPLRRFSSFWRCLCLAVCLVAALSSCKSSRPSKPTRGYATPTRGTARPRLTARPAAAKAVTVIETARTYLGVPYQYGGASRRGMDCSGLLVTSFRAVGVTLPRVSAQQATVGQPVGITELRPGDLLFFSDKKPSRRISHAGLVTAVDADAVRFIHATVHRGVMEDDLFSQHWHGVFVKATRPTAF